MVDLQSLIMDVSPVAYHQLRTPSTHSTAGGGLGDDEFRKKARIVLMQAFMKPDNNAYARKVQKFYEDNNLDRGDKIEAYNAWMTEHLPKDKAAIIKPNVLFGGISMDQKIGVGLYMVGLGQLEI